MGHFYEPDVGVERVGEVVRVGELEEGDVGSAVLLGDDQLLAILAYFDVLEVGEHDAHHLLLAQGIGVFGGRSGATGVGVDYGPFRVDGLAFGDDGYLCWTPFHAFAEGLEGQVLSYKWEILG